jgi:hypothetical protein
MNKKDFLNKKFISTALEYFGGVLIIIGVANLHKPTAIILAGVLLIVSSELSD